MLHEEIALLAAYGLWCGARRTLEQLRARLDGEVSDEDGFIQCGHMRLHKDRLHDAIHAAANEHTWLANVLEVIEDEYAELL